MDHYGHVTDDGTARATLANHFRALGDLLGITDKKLGLPPPIPKLATPLKPKGNTGEKGGYKLGGSTSHEGNYGRSGGNVGTGLSGEDRPIILDLDGSGVEITQLSNSTVFVDSSGDGLLNRTAWAAAGNGVLFYDADGDGTISEKREYVFTEWDPTATSDIEALKAVFDSNGDGVFDANDDAWSDFKVLVTQTDGSLVAKTLDELGIASIDLTCPSSGILGQMAA